MAISNDQLKVALAEMLPRRLLWDNQLKRLHWLKDDAKVQWPEVLDSELHYICFLIMTTNLNAEELKQLDATVHPTDNWDLLAVALAKIKGINL